MPAWPL